MWLWWSSFDSFVSVGVVGFSGRGSVHNIYSSESESSHGDVCERSHPDSRCQWVTGIWAFYATVFKKLIDILGVVTDSLIDIRNFTINNLLVIQATVFHTWCSHLEVPAEIITIIMVHKISLLDFWGNLNGKFSTVKNLESACLLNNKIWVVL